jgi:amidohydrolase
MPSPTELRTLIKSHLPDLIRIRHDLHQHPELAYQEKRTSAAVSTELTRLNIAHKSGLAGGTGVLAYIPPTNKADEQKGSIALRADMDALPIEENTGRAYASKTRGIMHACGHDGHTTNLLGVARILSLLPHRPNGVTLVFQPAEEGGAGGKRMCEDGALAGTVLGPEVREIFGLHGWPQYDVGVVGSKPGPLLAATDNMVVTIRGTQSHAAYPQYSADPIAAASQIITALQTIASRNIAPQDSIVVTIATINGGTARNIIPGHITFGGTMRTLTPETRVLGKRRFYEIAWEEGYPVTFNNEESTKKFFRIAESTFDASRITHVPSPSLGGEDFSYYGHHVPACFFILGVRPPGRTSYPSLHQPEYDFNDDALEAGIEMMCRLALDA